MAVIAIICIAVFALAMLSNLIIHLTLIGQLTRFCLQTNTLNQYWPTFFKAGFHAKALISSVIGTALALVVFMLLTPVVLIRHGKAKKNDPVHTAFPNEEEWLK